MPTAPCRWCDFRWRFWI